MCTLSIIIVNYKNQALILNCIRSIIAHETNLNYEIIVVDNASNDNSEQLLKELSPDIKYIQMRYNSGFGRANNEGMKLAQGKYMLLLNSDVLLSTDSVLSDCIEHLESLEDHERKVLGVRLTNQDGSFQESLRLKFPGFIDEIRKNPFYILIFERILKRKNHSKERQKEAHYRSGNVTWINGAFLLMHRETILSKHLFFDKDFFLYGEDMEWCWRANKSGVTFYHWHEPELIHIGSASSDQEKEKVQQVMASDWLFHRKTRGFLFTLILMKQVFVNQVSDGLFHFFAKLIGKKFSENVLWQQQIRKWTLQVLKRYAVQVLFRSKHSDDHSFKINCYEADQK